MGANFILEDLLKELQKRVLNIVNSLMKPPQIYQEVTKDLCLSCHKQVKLGVFCKYVPAPAEFSEI